VLGWVGLGPPAEGPPADPHPTMHARPIPQLATVELPGRVVGRGAARHDLTASPIEDFYRAAVEGHEPVSGSDAAELESGEFVVVDFGREVFGRPEVVIEAGEGVTVDLAAGEDVGADGRPVVLPRNWVMRYTAAGGRPETVQAFDPVGLRYLSVWASGPARVVNAALGETHYPRPEGAWFRSSDPDLDAIWEAGARTLDLCSTDAYVDCPGREQRAWLGDAYVHQLVSLVANPDAGLVRHNLRLHAQSRRPDGLLEMFAGGDIGTYPYVIPDYSLHWIRANARAWEYLGDEALLDQNAPLFTGILDWFEAFRGPDGVLTDVPSWVFIDWAQTDRSRQTAAVDALYALALDDAAGLHRARGDERSAAAAEARAAATRTAFRTTYWDAHRGVFVDAAEPGGLRSRRVSQQTNALAVLAGLVPAGEADELFKRILDPDRVKITKTPADSFDDLERGRYQWAAPPDFDPDQDVVGAQPFFCHFLHQALAAAGHADSLAGMARRWKPFLDDGYGCFGEFWRAEPGAASRCHAWSATPTFDLTRHVAGIAPLAPGCGEVAVRPRLSGLDWIDVSMPVPQGFVRVELRQQGGRLAGRVETPPGVRAVVELEGGWRGSTEGGVIEIGA
jgi:alpha-L-rhamnosidase